VQDAAHALPGLIDLLGISYLTLHLAVTVAVLLWLHRRRRAAFPLVRTTLVLASGLALCRLSRLPDHPHHGLAGSGSATQSRVTGIVLLGARLIATPPHRRWRTATETRRRAGTEDVRGARGPMPLTRPNLAQRTYLPVQPQAAKGQQPSEIGLAQPRGI
jgi:hypothetical protein